MAILTPSSPSGSDFRLLRFTINAVAPKGNFSARCVDILEVADFEEENRQVPGTMIKKDKIAFLFAVVKDGATSFVQSWDMNITGGEKSNLVKFICDMLGEKPGPGFDTSSLLGKVFNITVNKRTSQKGLDYAYLHSIAPSFNEDADKTLPALEDIKLDGERRHPLTKTETQKDPF